MLVAEEFGVAQMCNSRRGGRVLGAGLNQILGAVEAGAEAQKFGGRTINLRRT